MFMQKFDFEINTVTYDGIIFEYFIFYDKVFSSDTSDHM